MILFHDLFLRTSTNHLLGFVRSDRQRNEYQCEHPKDECLDKTDEYLEEHERQRNKIRHKECHDGEQDLAREHIAEKTKRERDNFSKF